MTKKGWGPISRLTFDGRIEETLPPTQDEWKDLHRELMMWRDVEAQPKAMPDALWEKLRSLIDRQLIFQFPWTQEEKDRVRWHYVRMGMARYGWGKGLKDASEKLKGTPAVGGVPTMRLGYQKTEKRLQPEKRRRRTYRRNPRLR
jgi:hypothetical protein